MYLCLLMYAYYKLFRNCQLLIFWWKSKWWKFSHWKYNQTLIIPLLFRDDSFCYRNSPYCRYLATALTIVAIFSLWSTVNSCCLTRWLWDAHTVGERVFISDNGTKSTLICNTMEPAVSMRCKALPGFLLGITDGLFIALDSVPWQHLPVSAGFPTANGRSVVWKREKREKSLYTAQRCNLYKVKLCQQLITFP